VWPSERLSTYIASTHRSDQAPRRAAPRRWLQINRQFRRVLRDEVNADGIALFARHDDCRTLVGGACRQQLVAPCSCSGTAAPCDATDISLQNTTRKGLN